MWGKIKAQVLLFDERDLLTCYLPSQCAVQPTAPRLYPPVIASVHQRICVCAACIFNRNSNPLTLLQLNFQAPKHILTLKPTRTRTGLSISSRRSWMPLALRLRGLSAQVSSSLVFSAASLQSHSSLIYHNDNQIFTLSIAARASLWPPVIDSAAVGLVYN